MPRRSAVEAELTRGRILSETMQQMSVHGATGISLAALADSLGMSKAGVVGPFHSREALLIEAFGLGAANFRARVVDPVLSLRLEPGTERLRVLVDGWVGYLVDSPFRGGCLLTSASFELDDRPGVLRDHVVEAARQWKGFLHAQLAEAVTAGHELPQDAADVTATLIGFGMALNQAARFHDADGQARIARLMREVAGL